MITTSKRYESVYELEAELIAQGYTTDYTCNHGDTGYVACLRDKNNAQLDSCEACKGYSISLPSGITTTKMTNTLEAAKIRCLKLNGYKIELSTNIKGKPVAKYYKLLTAGKNKDTYKLIEGYYFQTEDRRNEWIAKVVTRIKERANDKQTAKDAKKSVRDNFVNPFIVGDIYYDSWGYDQTNVDFYEIVEVKAKSVVLQEIGGSMVEGSGGMMCCSLMPDPSNKIKEPFLKPVIIRLTNDNKPIYYIHSRHGSISKYEKGDKGVYCSWYA